MKQRKDNNKESQCHTIKVSHKEGTCKSTSRHLEQPEEGVEQFQDDDALVTNELNSKGLIKVIAELTLNTGNTATDTLTTTTF